ncbi:MAG: hypothetical protein ACR2OZ_07355 [Verrucomicrobiales bacterium]
MSVVSALTIMLISAAVLIFQAIGSQQRRISDYGGIELGSETMQNLYGLSSPTINTWFAPNYGRAIRADQMREFFYDDVETASAVYCLARVGRNNLRPTALSISATLRGVELDTPAAFLTILAASEPAAAATFASYRGAPPSSAKNGSIFIIQPSENASPNELSVRSIWEVDIIPVVSPSGTYGTVRRYVGTQLTHYYDIFYKVDSSAFGPVFVNFERAARLSTGPGAVASIEAFKRAAAHPFYFVWWPDPVCPKIRGALSPTDAAGNTIASTDFRAAYSNHYGQTNYFFVVPMFPCVR